MIKIDTTALGALEVYTLLLEINEHIQESAEPDDVISVQLGVLTITGEQGTKSFSLSNRQ